jgi:hypothetical protein
MSWSWTLAPRPKLVLALVLTAFVLLMTPIIQTGQHGSSTGSVTSLAGLPQTAFGDSTSATLC